MATCLSVEMKIKWSDGCDCQAISAVKFQLSAAPVSVSWCIRAPIGGAQFIYFYSVFLHLCSIYGPLKEQTNTNAIIDFSRATGDVRRRKQELYTLWLCGTPPIFASPSRAYINPVVTSVRRVGQLRQFSPPILQLCFVVISSRRRRRPLCRRWRGSFERDCWLIS